MQLALDGLLFSQDWVTLLVKWYKTLQNRQNTTTIPLPLLGSSPMCPVSALKALIQRYLDHNNAPVFRIPTCHVLSHSIILLLENTSKSYPHIYCKSSPISNFMILERLALLGLSNLVFPWRRSRPMAPGLPTACGIIFLQFRSLLPLLAELFNYTYMLSLAIFFSFTCFRHFR